MTFNDPSGGLKTHLPDPGALGVALLEHLIEPVIGKDAIKVIREPSLKQDLRDKLHNALLRAEKKFTQQYSDKELTQALIDLPIATLPNIQQAVQEYWQDPFSPSLSNVLHLQLQKDLPNLEFDRIKSAVQVYLDNLRRELVLVSGELREILQTLIQLENQRTLQNGADHLEGSLEYLKSIDARLETIVGHMVQVPSEKHEQIVSNSLQGKVHIDEENFVHLIEQPGGTMDPASPFYVERDADQKFFRLISPLERKGVTVTIKAPRQMGKSSLLARGIAQALQHQKHVVYIDFEQFSEKAHKNPLEFLRQFCTYIAKDLNLASNINSYWDENLDPIRACTDFMENAIFKVLPGPLVLALDEVDLMLGSPLCSEYFGMLRSWHNLRWKPGWKSLDLLMVISTEPYMLINKASQSPFNVSPPIILPEFTQDQIAVLNRRHGCPLLAEQLLIFLEWFGGQPYLSRLAFYEIVTSNTSLSKLLDESCKEGSPFADHLWRYLEHLETYPELWDAMKQILTTGACSSEKSIYRLRSAGLVSIDGKNVSPRSKLYETYFRSHLL